MYNAVHVESVLYLVTLIYVFLLLIFVMTDSEFFARIRQDCLHENKRIIFEINEIQKSETSET